MKHNTATLTLFTLGTLLLFSGCSDKDKSKSLTEGGMKCGAGKCGSSMVDGSAVLVKKKMNILEQIDKKDERRDCVLKAKTTKALYNCVRDPETGRLTVKETEVKTFKTKVIPAQSSEKKAPQKKNDGEMKCAAGKCSGS